MEEALAQVIDVAGAAIKGRHARWYAIKLLEGEQLTIDALKPSRPPRSRIARRPRASGRCGGRRRRVHHHQRALRQYHGGL
ncbi:MAG: hypothetical protein ACLTDR_04870 [Adlercreutzia equolifaciens]